MTVNEARQAIFAQFNTAWAGATPIAWDNLDYKPNGSEFVRLTVKHNLGSQESLGGIGGRVYRKLGLIFVQIFTPLGIAADRSDELAQLAINALRDSTTGSLWFRNHRVNDIGRNGEDSYYQLNVVIDFIYDEIK